MTAQAAENLERPWESMRQALEANNTTLAHEIIESLSASDNVRAILQLDEDERIKLLELVEAETAAWLIEQMPDETAASLFVALDVKAAAGILDELDSDDQADLLGEMTEEEAAAILDNMEARESSALRQLMSYDENTAGGLMMSEVFKFREDETVSAVIRQLSDPDSDFERYRGQHPYIVNRKGQLVGVVSLRGLLTSARSAQLKSIMTQALIVKPDASLPELRDYFDEYPFLGLPVVNGNNMLLGVVSRDALADAELERAESEVQKLQGVVNEELRSMPTVLRARRRLSWLTLNIGLNIIAASIIAFYEDTLAAVIALAVFLPIVSDMSGCSGNQAVAVSLRELSLGVTRPGDVFRVWRKEAAVGVINGLALGVLIALAAWAWKGNPYIGLVVGLALGINTVVAVSIGGTVPLILKRFGADPAVASGPMLTTITDMFGFFLVLSLATAMMPLLV
jgi:magnesium transporter